MGVVSRLTGDMVGVVKIDSLMRGCNWQALILICISKSHHHLTQETSALDLTYRASKLVVPLRICQIQTQIQLLENSNIEIIKKKKTEGKHQKKEEMKVSLFIDDMLLLSHFSYVRPCATPQMAAPQAPPSLGFSRQKQWNGLPFPSPMHESEK